MRTILSEQTKYTNAHGAAETDLMKVARSASDRLGKTPISLGVNEGRLLKFLIQLSQVRTVVEIGTLTGYSGLWILEGLHQISAPHKKFWTLEKDPAHAQAAREVFSQWKGDVSIEVLEGDANSQLEKLSSQAPFDAVFIDANKGAYLDYLKWSVANLRSGGLILADNVFLRGQVFEGSSREDSVFSAKQVSVMQEFNRILTDPARFSAVIIPTEEGLLAAQMK